MSHSQHEQIADLKSTMAREQKELREKINSLQKQHTDRVSEMQSRLIAMQRQINSQSKPPRPSNTSAQVQPPLVI